MNRGLSKCLALFFAACFLALQFHPIGEPQSEHNDKRIFHIEEVRTSEIDESIDNRFIYVQQHALKHVYLSQQKTKLKLVRKAYRWAFFVLAFQFCAKMTNKCAKLTKS